MARKLCVEEKDLVGEAVAEAIAALTKKDARELITEVPEGKKALERFKRDVRPHKERTGSGNIGVEL